MENKTLSKVDLFLFWFLVLDTLFFPYFWVRCISYSFPLILFIFLFQRQKLARLHEVKIKRFLLLALISTTFGCLIYSKVASDSIVIFFQLFSSFVLFRYFCWIREHCDVTIIAKIHKCLYYFIIFIFAFSILFYVDANTYEMVKHFFNYRIEESSVDVYTSTIRFGYYWSDENNIGYMVNAVMLFLCLDNKISLIKKLIVVTLTSIITIATMSSGAILAYAFSIITFTVYQLIEQRKSIASYIIMIIFVITCIYFSYLVIDSDIYKLFLIRQEAKTIDGDSRSDIYRFVVDNVSWWKYVIWGYGGRTVIGGVVRSAHNGILYTVLSYGMISCYYYLRIVYTKLKGQQFKYWLWRIPVFIGFFLNIMITEEKISYIIILMLSFESYANSNDSRY